MAAPDPDRLPPARVQARQQTALRRYLLEEVRPFSPIERRRLDAAGGDPARIRPVAWADVDGLARILRPTPETLARSPHRWAWRWHSLVGGRAGFVERRLDPRYRAIHYDAHDGLPVASTAADLDVLADLGRRWLERAGVTSDDVVVSVLPAGPDVGFWQLALGCRRGGVPAFHLGVEADAVAVAECAPTVLAGGVEEVAAVAGAGAAPRLVLVVGHEPLHPDDRADLSALFGGATVLVAWAPPGVRALWAECRGGALHTWSDTEVVEAGPGGELLWTPIGWRGTVVLRLRTGYAGSVLTGACPACGRSSPRLAVTAVAGASPGDDLAPVADRLATVLDHHDLVEAWYAVVDGAGRVEVHLAPPAGSRRALEAELAGLGPALDVDAAVVEHPDRVAAVLVDHDGRRALAAGELHRDRAP